MENLPTAQQLSALYETLFVHYGHQGWWPIMSRAGEEGYDEGGYHPGIYPSIREDGGALFDVACGAVLTQNTSWKNAESALREMRMRGIDSFPKIAEADIGRLADTVRSSGYYNQKAKKLKALTGTLSGLGAPGKIDPASLRKRLLQVWGLGPETVDSILLYAFDIPYFVLDAYTQRLVGRLFGSPALCRGGGWYPCLQDLFHRSIRRDTVVYGEYHALIVRHCKEACTVRPRCDRCMLTPRCRYYLASVR